VRSLAITTLLIAAVSSFAACESSTEPKKPDAPTSANGGTSTAGVDVVSVEARTVSAKLRLPAELSAWEWVALDARVEAIVDDVLVDRGSVVKRGQTLVKLSAPELHARRAEAEAKLVGDKATADRLRAASATEGAVAHHDLELADANVKADEAQVASLAALEQYLVVRAPFDGIVTERDVHPGALVGPSSGPLVKLDSNAKLRLTVAVPEAAAANIVVGKSVDFSVPALPGVKLTGVVARVAHAVDAKTRSMAVELDVDNKDGRLAPGMYADVAWPAERATPSIVVPASSIAQTPDGIYVDRVKGGVLERVAVERGLSLPNAQQEVFGALAAGDVVLLRGSEVAKDGDKLH
jgi:RND family efflux transporter MFP subunit